MVRAAVDAWFEAFRSKDVTKLETALAEDFVHVSPFGEIRGRAVYVEMVRENQAIFFGQEMQILDVLTDGDRCAVRYEVGGMSACEFLYVRGDKVAEIQAYYHAGPRPAMPALARWYGG